MMKKLIALLMALIMILGTVPVLAEETAEEEAARLAYEERVRQYEEERHEEHKELLRDRMEMILPIGGSLDTLHKVVNDDDMGAGEKATRVLASMTMDLVSTLWAPPGLSGFLNDQLQSALDIVAEDGTLDKPFENVSENDKEKMNMYLKACDQAIDNIVESVSNAVDKATDTVKDAALTVVHFFTSWF